MADISREQRLVPEEWYRVCLTRTEALHLLNILNDQRWVDMELEDLNFKLVKALNGN